MYSFIVNMNNYMKAISKHNRRGAVIVLFALAIPFVLLLFGLGIDMGIIFMEKQALQNVADAAALAGATERFQGNNKNSTLPSRSEGCAKAQYTIPAANKISERIYEYLNANGMELAPATNDGKSNCQDISNIGAKAFQYTNFTADDTQVYSFLPEGAADYMENYSSLFSNYEKDTYDGPALAVKKENIGKIAVQCGVPVNNPELVRVRLRKIVPTFFMQIFFPNYNDGMPVTVVAAAASRKPMSRFRLVGLHGIFWSYTNLASTTRTQYEPDSYLQGDVYAGENLSVLATGTGYPSKGNAGYGANTFVVKGNIYVRNYSNGTPETIGTNSYTLKESETDDSGDLFYRLPSPDGTRNGEYLYYRIKDDKAEYALESALDARGTTEDEGWMHVYNFNRFLKWERCKVWNEDIQRFIPFPPHLMRIGVAPKSDREAFLKATKEVMTLRINYRAELFSKYKLALQELQRANGDTTKTKWRYLHSTTGENDNNFNSKNTTCTIQPSDSNINLLVEIDGVPTTCNGAKSDNYLKYKGTKQSALAYLNLKGATFNQKLTIDTMVVVIKDRPGTDYNDSLAYFEEYPDQYTASYHNGPNYNRNTAMRTQTGTLFINNEQRNITFGDIYSEANLVLNKSNIYNGILFSEKGIHMPAGCQNSSFTGSCSVFGNRIFAGYKYNINGSDLTAGLDYPCNVLLKKRHLVNTKFKGATDAYKLANNEFNPRVDGDTPMHYVLCGLSDKEYHAKVFEQDDDDKPIDDTDPEQLTLEEYPQEYNYHWFNPNLKLSYIPVKRYTQTNSQDYPAAIPKDILDVDKILDSKVEAEPAEDLDPSVNYQSKYALIQKTNSPLKHYLNIKEYPKYSSATLATIKYLQNKDPQFSFSRLGFSWYSDTPPNETDPSQALILGYENWNRQPSNTNYYGYYWNNDASKNKHIVAFIDPNTDIIRHFYIKSQYYYSMPSYRSSEAKNAPYEQLLSFPPDKQPFTDEDMDKDTKIAFASIATRYWDNNSEGHYHNNALYTPYMNYSLEAATEDEAFSIPWIFEEKTTNENNINLYKNYKALMNATDSNSVYKEQYQPWYTCARAIGSRDKTSVNATDQHLNMLDANKVFLSYWLRSVANPRKNEQISNAMNPFRYLPPDTGLRERFAYQLKGMQLGTGNGAINVQFLDTGNATYTQREAQIFRYTIDLDMYIKYKLDDLIRFTGKENNNFSVSDGSGERVYDEATGKTPADMGDGSTSFGTYPTRNDTAIVNHSFNVQEETLYTSINLVE